MQSLYSSSLQSQLPIHQIVREKTKQYKEIKIKKLKNMNYKKNYTFLVLNLSLDVVNGVARFNFKGDGLPC